MQKVKASDGVVIDFPNVFFSKKVRANGELYYSVLIYDSYIYNEDNKFQRKNVKVAGRIESSNGVGEIVFKKSFLTDNPTFDKYRVFRKKSNNLVAYPVNEALPKEILPYVADISKISKKVINEFRVFDENKVNVENQIQETTEQNSSPALAPVDTDNCVILEGIKFVDIANPKDVLNVIKQQSQNSLIATLGIKFTYIKKGYVEAKLLVSEKCCRYADNKQILNGGVSAAFAESITGLGSVVVAPTDTNPCGVTLTINHIRVVMLGSELTARATLVNNGSKLHVWRVEIFNAQERLVSSASITNMLVKKK